MASGRSAARTGRTQDCIRPLRRTSRQPLQCGSHPHRTFRRSERGGKRAEVHSIHARGSYRVAGADGHVSMARNKSRLWGALILFSVLVSWAIILFHPSRRPEVLPSLSGCYRGVGPLSAVEMVLSPSGTLALQGHALKVEVAEDKGGLSLLPDQRLTYDPAFPSRLAITSASPLLVRISGDRRSLTIPGGVADIVFKKGPCSPPAS